jgi:hypothetical protein
MINVAIGLAAALVCLLLQALTAAFALRLLPLVARNAEMEPTRGLLPPITGLLLFLLLLLVGICVQMIGWASLYYARGGFADFNTSLYFSGVTFTSLGYGDLVLPRRLRLLAPLEATIGMLMLGMSTALFVAAGQRVIDVRRKAFADLEESQEHVRPQEPRKE